MSRDIFISYRRQGGYETAHVLYRLLKDDGYGVTFDLDTLRSGRFDKALLRRIDEATDFIVILNRDCFKRTLDPASPPENDWVRCELAHALLRGKNVIPIRLAGFDFPDKLPDDIDEVRLMHGPTYSREYFDAFYEKLKRTFLRSVPTTTRGRPSREVARKISPAPSPRKKKNAASRKSDATGIILSEFGKIKEVVGSDLYIGDEVPDGKLEMATTEWGIPYGTLVPVLFDPTVTGGFFGLDGFAVTPKGIFIKNPDEEPKFFKWSEISLENTWAGNDFIIVAGYSLGTYQKEEGNRALLAAISRCQKKLSK